MREQIIELFTDEEEEFVNLFITVGARKTVARVLVYLLKNKQVTSRDLERGTDLRQPEVSIAIHELIERGWIRTGEIPSEKKGRPQKTYTLKVSADKIHSTLEKETKDEAARTLALVRKLKDFV